MKKTFGLQTNDNCDRGCSHCFVDSSMKGKSVDFSDLEMAITQIGTVVKSQPDNFEDVVGLTGGEVLLYNDGVYTLGDIIDLLHKNGLRMRLITRGWTDSEQKQNLLQYQNFQEVQKRFPAELQPEVTVSYDTYTLGNRGDNDIAMHMARNAINGAFSIGAIPIISTITSVERALITYEAVLKLMNSMGFSLAPECSALDDYSSQKVADLIIKKYSEELILPMILFQDVQGKKFKVLFSDLMLDGRAKSIDETPMKPFYNCRVADQTNFYFMIRADLGLTPCCNNDFLSIPAIGNLREEQLYTILGKFDLYSQAVKDMHQNVWMDLERQKKDICTVCADELPKYLAKVGF